MSARLLERASSSLLVGWEGSPTMSGGCPARLLPSGAGLNSFLSCSPASTISSKRRCAPPATQTSASAACLVVRRLTAPPAPASHYLLLLLRRGSVKKVQRFGKWFSAERAERKSRRRFRCCTTLPSDGGAFQIYDASSTHAHVPCAGDERHGHGRREGTGKERR